MTDLPGVSLPSSQQIRRMQLGRRFPSTTRELQAIVAASDVPVKKLPPGPRLSYFFVWPESFRTNGHIPRRPSSDSGGRFGFVPRPGSAVGEFA
jgi:hypothetical protein